MDKNNEFKKEKQMKKLEEERKNKYNDNNNKDPYGYDFVPTISHWTNIDDQRKEVSYLENIEKDNDKLDKNL